MVEPIHNCTFYLTKITTMIPRVPERGGWFSKGASEQELLDYKVGDGNCFPGMRASWVNSYQFQYDDNHYQKYYNIDYTTKTGM